MIAPRAGVYAGRALVPLGAATRLRGLVPRKPVIAAEEARLPRMSGSGPCHLSELNTQLDLIGAKKDFRFTGIAWGAVLRLANQHGWEPAGTMPPKYPPGIEAPSGSWSGSYFTNDAQEVTEADAAHIAESLERALPDLPDHDALSQKTVPLPGGYRGIAGEVTPYELFSGRGKERLQDFIAFCREGSFRIW